MASFNAYINKNSVIHHLNPSLKFLSFVLLIIMVFLPIGFFGQIILFGIVLSFWITAKLPWRLMKGIIKSMIFMFALLFIINWITNKAPGVFFDITSSKDLLFTSPQFFAEKLSFGHGQIFNIGGKDFVNYYGFIWGGHSSGFTPIAADDPLFLQTYPWADSPSLKTLTFKIDDTTTYYFYYLSSWYSLSDQVIIFATFVTLKIFIMIMIVTLLTSTTTSIELTFAIEDILNPFRILRVPVNEWAMTIAIAIRFVPSLIDESQRILKAQASRGVDFGNGNFNDKIKALVSLVVPMFSVAFRKADDLANAMEARSYNPRYERTRYRNFLIKWSDWVFFGVISFVLGFFIAVVGFNLIFGPFAAIDLYLV